jgi:CheY-like chemotaxis protein
MPRKLLLADDSITIQRVIELTFSEEDIQVIAVGDGQQAIERIESERPDVVLADAGMPERDGYEVASFVKGNSHLAHIPVVLLTGAFEPVDEARARAAGCDGVLVKPFEPQMVINRVKDLLAGRRPESLWATPPPEPEHKLSPGVPLPTEAAPVVPSPPGQTDGDADVAVDSLDAYFDRIDAAFAGLTEPGRPEPALAPTPQPAAPSAVPAPQAAELDLPPPVGGHALAADAFDALEPGPVRDVETGLGSWDPGLSGGEPARAVRSDDDQPPATQPAAPSEPSRASVAPSVAPEPAAVAPSPTQPVALPSLSEAFKALLAVERGDASAPVPSAEPATATTVLSDETLELVVTRVLERLTADVVRDTVVDVAERLVREEIVRIRNAAR